MSYRIADDEYLDLWKYFEDRADNVKEAMFNSVTWVIGFAAAVFGFVLTKLVELTPTQAPLANPSTRPNMRVVIAASCVGLLLCVYSLILVFESRKQILANWKCAGICQRNIDGLDAIWTTHEHTGDIKIWHSILAVVALFIVGFVAVLVSAA